MTNDWPRRWTAFWLAMIFEGSLGLLAWAIGWAVDQPPWQKLFWNPGDFVLGLVATVPLLAVFGLCVGASWRPLVRIRRICDEVIRPFFAASSVLELAAISGIAAVGEEMLFRGVMQAGLERWLGQWTGILASSVLFGAAHLITPTYGVLVTLEGIYLGWVYAASGNLMVVIVAHGLYDFLALVYLQNVLISAPGAIVLRRPGAS